MSPRSERLGHLNLKYARKCLKIRVKNWEQNSLQLQIGYPVVKSSYLDDALSGILDLEGNSVKGQKLLQEVKKREKANRKKVVNN